MRRLAALAVGSVLLLTTACGSDDDPAADEPTPSASESSLDAATEATATASSETSPTIATATAEAGELPTYEEVKALWLASTSQGDRDSCASGETEDKRIGGGEGEYIRFVCSGIARFQYVTGADNYADNFETASADLVGRAVFHVPGEMFVSTSGSNTDLAPAIKVACGCGVVVGPTG